MRTKIFSLLGVVAILTMLILAGPAQGFTLNLSLDDSSPTEGDTITFTAEVDILSGERLPVDYLTLELTGPETVSCRFNADGTVISGCKGISIALSQSSNLGYGYGYGYFGYGYNFGYGYGYETGKLIYTITLDTSDYSIGTYSTELKAKIGNNEFSEQGSQFTISEESSSSGGSDNDDEDDYGSCVTDWECGEWSACIDGQQTRTCEKERLFCTAGALPEEIRACGLGLDFDFLGDTGIFDNPIELNENIEDSTGFVSRITGAVSGVFSGSNGGILLIIVMVSFILVALIIVISVRARRHSVRNRSSGKFY